MTALEDHAQRVMDIASERRMTLATVESCTAGSLVRLLAQGEGASATLHGGFVGARGREAIASAHVPICSVASLLAGLDETFRQAE
jgi:nicotinamide mononucleotide (NMN) deamidase PncC